MIPHKPNLLSKPPLTRQAAGAVIGPRQGGKTTLAHAIAGKGDSVYLDLEAAADRAKLADPVLFLEQYTDNLVVLDEIHRMPELFQELRGNIDRGRRIGKPHGRFLILGSASIDRLGISSPTVNNYIGLLVDLLLVCRLQSYHANVGKWLVKSPKTYVRDSGLVHALLGIEALSSQRAESGRK